jgi:hypothetical protein
VPSGKAPLLRRGEGAPTPYLLPLTFAGPGTTYGSGRPTATANRRNGTA